MNQLQQKPPAFSKKQPNDDKTKRDANRKGRQNTKAFNMDNEIKQMIDKCFDLSQPLPKRDTKKLEI